MIITLKNAPTITICIFIGLSLLSACSPQFQQTHDFQSYQQSRLIATLHNTPWTQVIKKEKHLFILLSSDSIFPFNHLESITPQAQQILNAIARLIQHTSPTTTSVTVSAFTDQVGSEQEKIRRSYRQAMNIAAYLWHRGIKQNQLRIQGMSDHYPIVSPKKFSKLSDNRRIEIAINYS